MIDRYSRPEMTKLWSLENKFKAWLDIEILACEAQAELGVVPAADLAQIKSKAAFEVERILEIEAQVHHDVIAFLTNVNEHVGEAGRFIHYGLTSSDIGDTALSMITVQALDVISVQVERLLDALREKSRKYKYTPCMGRSHGVHAEPTTFGLKMALFYEAVKRSQLRIAQARKGMAVGKLSGAVGTFSNLDPFVEEYVCKKLGLASARIATQVIQRDRHAEVMSALAILASTLDQLAVEIRALQKTEVREVEEPFQKGQKGSSAMPHKRNPILCERISGLSRVVRGNLQAALEDVALWHERDISHSSVERVILPDSTILVDYMLHKMVFIIENLHVYPENMKRNIERTRGLIFSQKLLLKIIDKGFSREDAYLIVQDNAMKVWQYEEFNLMQEAAKDERLSEKISESELAAIFNVDPYLEKVDYLFHRAGLDD